MKKLPLLGNITAAEFLRDYWHKKPLLIRQAIPGFTPLLTLDQLTALARQNHIESRLVTQVDGAFDMQTGPLEQLPGRGQGPWTMLVQGVNLEDARADALLPAAPVPSGPETGPPLPRSDHAGRIGSARPRLADLNDQTVMAAMHANGWCISHAARALGISRPSMYKLLEAHAGIRAVAAIPLDEIEQALAAHDNDIGRCAAALKTPSEALRRHLRAQRLMRSMDRTE